jgi:type VI secretion system activator RovC-like protein
MPSPPLDPDVADLAPDDPVLTAYDEQHAITYLRLLDADADNADWREVARIVLHIDPAREPERARKAFDSHLARAKWMTSHGYRHLLRGGSADR